MTKLSPAQYRTTNWKDYNAALKARGSLSVWLDRDMQWHGQPTGRHGRLPIVCDAAIHFCLTIKGPFGLPLRQVIGFVQSLIDLAGLDWAAPDYEHGLPSSENADR